ncbi:MAG: hypothetical protein GWN53_17025 [Gammaproteobacteria bacterium]|uniref:Uncharacterized protein n=1 Tax=Candidatus Kutchimonas denitrificans TaxID=3056748 RepID=A0AAE4ZDM8_9BACT|nr:hypothetical protein [Candidatus Kutchimonas denitrificans]NIV53544.1 hypothetical protein [Gammaproteobacteria bacterium]
MNQRTKDKIDLVALQESGHPRLSADAVLSINAKDAEGPNEEEQEEIARTMEAARKYFRMFAEPMKKDGATGMMIGGVLCIGCGEVLNGFMGTFQYGIVHGEGTCSNCGYPCRTHHYIKDEDGEELLSLTGYLLQYHPDELKETA